MMKKATAPRMGKGSLFELEEGYKGEDDPGQQDQDIEALG